MVAGGSESDRNREPGYLVVGLEVLVTGLSGWSPTYALFGFSTKEKGGA